MCVCVCGGVCGCISQVLAEKLFQYTAEERKEKLKPFVSAGIEIGPVMRANLVSAEAKQLQNVNDVISCLRPWATSDSPTEFNALAPRLSDSGLGDVDKATLLLKSLVHECLLKGIHKGEEGAEEVFGLARSMLELVIEGERLPNLSPLISAATDDIRVIAEYLLSLQGEGAVPAQNSLRDAKDGAKSLVFQAIRQKEFWRRLDASARKYQLASASMGPEFKETVAALQDGGPDALQHAMKRLPVYLDNLSPKMTMQCVEAITVQAKQQAEKLKSSSANIQEGIGLVSSMEQFVKVMQTGVEIFEGDKNMADVKSAWEATCAIVEAAKADVQAKSAKQKVLGAIAVYLSEDL